jgi:Na+-translocating ferredoxin:NAD+ oxidoreductase RnfG subunit
MKIKSTVTVMIFVTVIVALVTITVGAIIDFPTSAFAGEQQQQQQGRFITELTGFEEVPPVNDTSAIGVAEFKLGQDNIMYTVNVTDIENVTAAHIHKGKIGENGDIVVTLCKTGTCSSDGAMNGALSVGETFNATNLEGPMAGKQIEDLANNMSNGGTYINVHTLQHPNGEIRGQITGGTQ